MATTFDTELSSYVAAADYSSNQYYFVELDANGAAKVCDAITDKAIGVLQNAPKAGQEALVKTYGNTKVVAGAALAVGDNVAPTAAGKAQVAVATQFVRGRVVTAAAADEDIATVLLTETAIALV